MGIGLPYHRWHVRFVVVGSGFVFLVMVVHAFWVVVDIVVAVVVVRSMNLQSENCYKVVTWCQLNMDSAEKNYPSLPSSPSVQGTLFLTTGAMLP